MTKKIAVINDLSGFGRCSLTAAISVISAMGVQPCPLPTAILTAQTGYSSYYCDDYTEKMEFFRKEWKKMNQSFDGIYTGFVASEEQIRQIFRFIDTFDSPETFLLVDPVLGDDGQTYDMFTPSLLEQMKKLAFRADIVTPNLTELALLTDTSYEALTRSVGCQQQFTLILDLGRRLLQKGPAHVIVTGIQFTDEHHIKQMGNLCISEDGSRMPSRTSEAAIPEPGICLHPASRQALQEEKISLPSPSWQAIFLRLPLQILQRSKFRAMTESTMKNTYLC